MREIKPERIYFAYDTQNDYEPLRDAAKLLSEHGLLKMRGVSVYCLCGYPSDTMEKAEARFWQVLRLGMCPYAMLWRDKTGKVKRDWSKFQRSWVLPQIIYTRVKKAGIG